MNSIANVAIAENLKIGLIMFQKRIDLHGLSWRVSDCPELHMESKILSKLDSSSLTFRNLFRRRSRRAQPHRISHSAHQLLDIATFLEILTEKYSKAKI